jgi:CRISPR-associated protein Cas1
LLQWEWAREGVGRLAAARTLISAKIRNVRLMVRRREESSRLLRDLKEFEDEAERAESIERLRGIEGQAAHAYFSRWDSWIHGRLGGFPGRTTRGAEDPVNAMLNLLYTQLFRLAHTTILSAGLDPYLGAFHEGKGRYAALAADLMEPFRFLVDRVVLDAVNLRRAAEPDFRRWEKGPYKLLIGPEAVKRLIADFEDLLARETEDMADRKDTFRGHLYRQAVSLRRHIEKRDDCFIAFRMKW